MKVVFKKIRVGDIFSFYVGNDLYAFARLIYFVERSFYITEVFNYKSSDGFFNSDVLSAPRLIRLVPINYLVNMNKKLWNWKVVYRDFNFQPPIEEISNLEFSVGLGQAIRYNTNWTDESSEMRLLSRDVSIEEASKLEGSDIQMNTHWLYIRIRELWNLKPFEWESSADMWNWFHENGLYFTDHK